MTLYVLDVSNYQAGLDMSRVAAEGFAAVSCKATEGVGFRDASFDTFIPQIQRSGMIPGAYHYLRAGDGAAQARQFHARVSEHGGPSGWLIQLDAESDGYGPEMTAWARQWDDLTGGHPFLMYSAAWWWPRTGGFRGAGLTPHLWHAHYVTGSAYAHQLYEQVQDSWWQPRYGGWPTATLLQFTDRAVVAGRQVDASAFRGSLADLLALTRRAPPPQPPGGTVATVRMWPGVEIGALGQKMAAVLAHSPRAAELWISSGMDGDHGPRPYGSHHYGLTYNGSPTGAVDFVGNAPGEGATARSQEIMRDTARWLYDNFSGLTVELIHTTPYPDDDGFYVQSGLRYPGGGPYAGDTAEEHGDHGHWSASETQLDEILARLGPAPTPAPPGLPDLFGDDMLVHHADHAETYLVDSSGVWQLYAADLDFYLAAGVKPAEVNGDAAWTWLCERNRGLRQWHPTPVTLADEQLDAIVDALVARISGQPTSGDPTVVAALVDEVAQVTEAVAALTGKLAQAAQANADALK